MELYCTGESAPAVAQELGVSVNGVYGLLRERELVRSRSDAQLLAHGRRIAEDRERRVQHTVEQLRACNGGHSSIHEELERKRLAWWEDNRERLQLSGPLVRQAYTLLEGCRRLGLDTRVVCRAATERSVEALIRRRANLRLACDRLRFKRNYETGMRPYAAYCEEEIWLAK